MVGLGRPLRSATLEETRLHRQVLLCSQLRVCVTETGCNSVEATVKDIGRNRDEG